MNFTTLPFYAVFIIFLMVFAVVRQRSRVGMLCYVVAFSLGFFYLTNARLFALLPCTAVLSWAMTEEMRRRQGRARWWLLWLTILLEIFPLLYYKYTNFGISLLGTLLQTNFPLLDIALPIGISFYTFQAISYTVDVYRLRFVGRPTLLDYSFYLTFFPLLLAGPITRAEVLLPQIMDDKPKVRERLVWQGLWLVMLGIFKKCVVADYIGQFNDWVFEAPLAYSGVENALAAVGYTVQIYCDFSGYSDMSIGMAAMMGFELKENFRFPFQATSVREFWHRWHISLSTWFRDYVYIPLGGNRKGRVRTYINNFLTMVLAGIWHGSTLMFVVWGSLHGLALLVQKAFSEVAAWMMRGRQPIVESADAGGRSVLHRAMTCMGHILAWLLTMTFVVVSFVIFRAQDMQTAMMQLRQSFLSFDWTYLPTVIMSRPLWSGVVLLFFVLHSTRERHFYRLQEAFIRSPWLVKVALFGAVVQLAVMFHSANVTAFIYTQF